MNPILARFKSRTSLAQLVVLGSSLMAVCEQPHAQDSYLDIEWINPHLSVFPSGIFEGLRASMCALPDVDGDGTMELLMGLASNAPTSVELVSGHTGLRLQTFSSSVAGDAYGREVAAAGDVDGDGVGDFFIGGGIFVANPTNEIRSGATMAVLHSLPMPSFVDTGLMKFGRLSDLNGDGRDEFLTALPNRYSYFAGGKAKTLVGGAVPRVRVHDGATGSVLLEVLGPNNQPFGEFVGGVGDLDGDGLEDIAVTTHDFVPLAPTNKLEFFNSVTGALIQTISSGYELALPIGDVDLDGIPDVAVGWYFGVEVRSGATGAMIWGRAGATNDAFGTALDTVDWNGDGTLDLVVGAPQRNLFCSSCNGYVEVLDGLNGAVLFRADGVAGDNGFGAAVASIGDVNGDGAQDLAVAGGRGNSESEVRIVSGVPLRLTSDLHQISLSAGATQNFAIDFPSTQANQLALLAGSASGHLPGMTFSSVFVPLNPDAFTTFLLAVFPTTMLDGSGDGSIALTFPAGFAPTLAGLQLHYIVAAFDFNGTLTDSSWALPTTLLP